METRGAVVVVDVGGQSVVAAPDAPLPGSKTGESASSGCVWPTVAAKPKRAVRVLDNAPDIGSGQMTLRFMSSKSLAVKGAGALVGADPDPAISCNQYAANEVAG